MCLHIASTGLCIHTVIESELVGYSRLNVFLSITNNKVIMAPIFVGYEMTLDPGHLSFFPFMSY